MHIDSVNSKIGFLSPCGQIKSIAWDYLKNFDHSIILEEDDPLLPKILEVYDIQGIKDGSPTNKLIGLNINNELAKGYPECRLIVVKKVSTCENLIEVFYSLLKNKLNIKKITFISGENCASAEF